MSRLPEKDPATLAPAGPSSLELVISSHPKDLGGFTVRRALPAVARPMVGPFVFFDHMGPATFAPGAGIDVRPHPHTALATITYLFEGEILHQDSLGSVQPIHPGDVNWMVAGHGIVHSERTRAEVRAAGGPLHGIQTWVALPSPCEGMAPRFEHHPQAALPELVRGGVTLRILAGTAYGVAAPTGVLSPTLYVHARFSPGADLAIDAEHEERAVYVARGAVTLEGQAFAEGEFLVLRPGATVLLASSGGADVMVVGGARLDGPRYLDWNFVASSKGRLAAAKAAWKTRDLKRFPLVPGDPLAFIPLPEAVPSRDPNSGEP